MKNRHYRLTSKNAKGSITVEFAIAMIIAAAIMAPVIPLVKDMSKQELSNVSERISPHYP